MKLTLTVTCAMGLESVLKQELHALGYKETTVFDGRIDVVGDFVAIAKLNLWLRTAGKVFVKIGEFEAKTFDELFEKTRALPWETWIGKTDKFPVSKISTKKATLFSKSDSQAIVKKAIADKLKKAYGLQRLPESSNAQYSIRIQNIRDTVTISIDTSGISLSKRGYRAHMDIAPIRETLAAGLVYLSRWRADKDVLLDPMCGSGTILIEAGMIGKNIAPGLKNTFAAEDWSQIPSKIWKTAREQAKASIKLDADFKLYGSDTNKTALSVARKNAELAGLDNVFFQKLDIGDVRSSSNSGKIITNPPYGHRLSEKQDCEALYRQLGSVVKQYFSKWDAYIICADKLFEKEFGKKATKKRKLFNGPLECQYYQFF